MWKKSLIVVCLMLPCWNLAQAGEARSVNFAVFQKYDKNFEFEPIVEGKFSDFITTMQGSQILALAHTADTIGGDVITFQTSVLRDENGSFGDFGIDCQLSFKDESTGNDYSYLLGGLCKIIQVGRGQNSKTLLVIPHTNVPDTTQGFEGWLLLKEDEKTGTAFYANVSMLH
ncbi:MAG: hypothetical protein Q9M19_05490 [Mariprofundaceae bacterium]|nr:hypothetical protein [Mariprofundaceae bacterium]